MARAQKRLRLVGCLILVAGLAVSFWAWQRASNVRADATRSAMADIQNSKAYQLQLEKDSGEAGVFSNTIANWFTGLWEGRQLGTTLAVLSAGSALLCFLVAHFLPQIPPFPSADEDRRSRR
jgi:hypothetical protein